MCATWLHIFKNFVKFVEELMLSNRLIFDRWNTSDSDWKCQRAKTGRIQIESDRIEPNTNLSIRVNKISTFPMIGLYAMSQRILLKW